MSDARPVDRLRGALEAFRCDEARERVLRARGADDADGEAAVSARHAWLGGPAARELLDAVGSAGGLEADGVGALRAHLARAAAESRARPRSRRARVLAPRAGHARASGARCELAPRTRRERGGRGFTRRCASSAHRPCGRGRRYTGAGARGRGRRGPRAPRARTAAAGSWAERGRSGRVGPRVPRCDRCARCGRGALAVRQGRSFQPGILGHRFSRNSFSESSTGSCADRAGSGGWAKTSPGSG